MTVAQKIREDLTAAMKAHDELRKEVLRSAIAAFTNELVAKGKKPTEEIADADAHVVLKRLAKQRKEASEQFSSGGRPELAEKETKELIILEEYVPEQVSEEDIEKAAKAKIEELGISDKSGMGQLMGAVMKEFGGNADGNMVKQVVEKLLP